MRKTVEMDMKHVAGRLDMVARRDSSRVANPGLPEALAVSALTVPLLGNLSILDKSGWLVILKTQ